MKFIKLFFAVFVALLFVSAPASASVTLPTDVPVTDVSTWAGTILVGLTVIWGVRKLIAMTNKS